MAHLDVARKESVEEVHVGSTEVTQVLELLNGGLLEFEKLEAYLK
jgi:hypothetical protein